MDPQQIIDQATLEISEPGELKRPELLSILKSYRFCRITGLLNPSAIRESHQRMRTAFDPANDHPVYGDTPADVQTNFQKLSIGRARHGGVDRPRFMRVFYNPIWAEDIYGLRDTFVRIATVRNILGGLRDDYAIYEPEDGMWTASRIHLFPTGGGFMVTHKDTVLPAIMEDNNIAGGYFQPIAVMTQKGEDFEKGGGILELNGETIEYEDYTKLGDILIYDSTTLHGVNDIDPNKPYRQDSMDGRMSGLVTLYKDMVRQ